MQISRVFVLSLIMIAFFVSGIVAQDVMKIPAAPEGTDISPIIHGDTTETGEWIDRIYELEGDGYYLVSERLNRPGAKLHIRGDQQGTFLPSINPKQAATGSYPSVIRHAGDMTLEYVQISNNNGDIDEWGGIRVTADGARIEITGCHIEDERGAGLFTVGNNISAFIRDTRFAKMGERANPGGNGRIVDLRSHDIDTLVVQNVTGYLIMDRMLRGMGGSIDYLLWDHNTVFNHQGRHGGLQLGKVNTAIITNNLFINTQYQGNHDGIEEQTQPENDDIYLITIDEINEGTVLEIRNNNFAWSNEIIEFWNNEPATSKPQILTPSIAAYLGDAVGKAYFEEFVTFVNTPSVPMDLLEALFMPEMPDPAPSWMDSDDVGVANIDASYSSEYVSYTAADNDFPLGDLNHFPELKAQWEAFETSVDEDVMIRPETFELMAAYPNPFNPTTNLSFALQRSTEVSMSVYNVLGQRLVFKNLGVYPAGIHSITFDASHLSSGIYIVQMMAGDEVQNVSITLLK